MALTGDELVEIQGVISTGASANGTFFTTTSDIANLSDLTGDETLEVQGITSSGLPSGQTFITTTGAISTLTGLTGDETLEVQGVTNDGLPSGQTFLTTTQDIYDLASSYLVAAANNNNLPINYNTSANWVHNAWTMHTSGPVDITNLEITFVNGTISADSEQNAGYDFVLRCGMYLNGTFYQGKVGALTEVTVAKEWGRATFTVPTLTTLPANTIFFITNRRVASDGGVAGSYDVITNAGGSTYRQDGIIAGTDDTKDYTLGVGIAYGATNSRVTAGQISAGVVTAVTKLAGGSGYSGGLNIGPWYGPAGDGAKGATIPGSGITGYGNSAAGEYTTTSILDGGINHDTANPPYIFVGGSSTAASGFGTLTATYGPSLIAGVPASATPSVLLQGDSITAGYGSVDNTGDLNANFGVYEQTLYNAYGVFKLAVGGESAAGWVATHTKQLAFIDAMIARGLRITHVIIGLGVNDFLNNTNTDVATITQGNITTIADIWRARGAKVYTVTIVPYTTSSDSWVTTANQTVGNANYDASGRVDTYNAAIVAGTPTSDGYIDIRTVSQAAAAPTKWRVDTYGGATAFCATDGIHLSKEVGIPYSKLNLSIPAFTV